MLHVHSLHKLINYDMPIAVIKHCHGEYVKAHSHEFYEFVYVESGFCSHNLSGNINVLFPGTLFAVRPAEVHEYFNVKDTNIYNCLFMPEAINEYFGEISRFPGLERVFAKESGTGWLNMYVHADSQLDISLLLAKMAVESEKRERGFDIKLKAHLYEFLILVSRLFEKTHSIQQVMGYQGGHKFPEILKLINSRISSNISVEELAAKYNLSADYFSRKFRQHVGMSPLEYIHTVKIAKAVELLRNTELTVSEIAFCIGMEDNNYFSRLFKKITQFTPTELRKKLSHPEKSLIIHS